MPQEDRCSFSPESSLQCVIVKINCATVACTCIQISQGYYLYAQLAESIYALYIHKHNYEQIIDEKGQHEFNVSITWLPPNPPPSAPLETENDRKKKRKTEQ